MAAVSQPDPVSVRLPRPNALEQRDLEALCRVRRAGQPRPYHSGEWTGIALHSMEASPRSFPARRDRVTNSPTIGRGYC